MNKHLYLCNLLVLSSPKYIVTCFGSREPAPGQFLINGHVAFPYGANSLDAPFPYTKNWPEDGSLEPKHVANYVLMIIYIGMCCI